MHCLFDSAVDLLLASWLQRNSGFLGFWTLFLHVPQAKPFLPE